jgi:predicted DNA-binding ribbon-helix-helix protein
MAVEDMEEPINGSARIVETRSKNTIDRGNGRGRSDSGHLRSLVLKRSVLVGRHRTSISLEDIFWNELRAIAKKSNIHLSQLISQIDAEREHCNLSSAIRMFVFQYRAAKIGSDEQTMKDNKQI